MHALVLEKNPVEPVDGRFRRMITRKSSTKRARERGGHSGGTGGKAVEHRRATAMAHTFLMNYSPAKPAKKTYSRAARHGHTHCHPRHQMIPAAPPVDSNTEPPRPRGHGGSCFGVQAALAMPPGHALGSRASPGRRSDPPGPLATSPCSLSRQR